MSDPGGRGFGGGDERDLSPFVTAEPVPDTIVRRDHEGFVRAHALQILLGLFEVGDVQLAFPLTAPPADTFLKHDANGVLEWVPPAAISGSIDWSQVLNTPLSLAGYGIGDAYTQTQIDAFFAALTFADIGGTAARGQLPSQIAYEDELNVFDLLQRFLNGIQTDVVNPETDDAGVTVDGLLVKNGRIAAAAVSVASPFASAQQQLDYLTSRARDPKIEIGQVITTGDLAQFRNLRNALEYLFARATEPAPPHELIAQATTFI
jgi:hypothetical protein